MDYLCRYVSPLGEITLASDGEALVGLWFAGQKHFGAGLSGQTTKKPLPVFDQAVRWLDRYFSGKKPDCPPPLRPRGTAFQQAVWRRLLDIPYGHTVTYGEIAASLGLPSGAARAVGGAVGRNPISLIIPCHRVVGAHGSLTGYAGGIERKKRLLELEREGKF
ncbi:MAG: methylated-DNA--[Clostridia bacterium]|nr:methylated-DNA--[protein]-cysteine S-methyltransferase [Clostridia bacterium]